MNEYIDIALRTKALLDIEREIVGVKFIFSKEEFESIEVEDFQKMMPYCRMVEKASRGEKIKASLKNFSCYAGARVLGLVEIDEFYSSGNYYNSCGLYQDMATSKMVTDNIARCSHKVYGILVQPLKDFLQRPDTVIIISKPSNMMRLVQGYSYIYGTYSNYKFIGNQAMCSECTANPYMNNSINISLLCSGTRETGISEEDMAMGIVYSKFVQTIKGLYKTMNVVENSKRKAEIKKNIEDFNISNMEIKKGNYGYPLYKYDNEYFKISENKKRRS